VRLFALTATLALGAGALGDLDGAVPARAAVQLPRPVEGRAGGGLPERPGDHRHGVGRDHGEGLGQGIQKVNFLPEAHTDMIFAVVGEELGFVGSSLVIAAFAVFAWAGLPCRPPVP
jgi:hypothetical protein